MSLSSPFSYFFFHSATSFRSKRSSALCSSIVAISSLSAAAFDPGLFRFVIRYRLHVRDRHFAGATDRRPQTALRFPLRRQESARPASPWCPHPSTAGGAPSVPPHPSPARAFSRGGGRGVSRSAQDNGNADPAR